MIPDGSTESAPDAALRESRAPTNLFTAADVAAILRERGWVDTPPSPAALALTPERLEGTGEVGAPALKPCSDAKAGNNSTEPDWDAWLADAAALLGPHAADRQALADLLSLVFRYDARAVLESPKSHVVLAREGAREVVRELAHLVLDGPEIDSGRLKEIVTALKEKLGFRGRELFHPIRLALAGRAGEGELDRVILLLDRAARLAFRVRVKSARERMLEFCASLE